MVFRPRTKYWIYCPPLNFFSRKSLVRKKTIYLGIKINIFLSLSDHCRYICGHVSNILLLLRKRICSVVKNIPLINVYVDMFQTFFFWENNSALLLRILHLSLMMHWMHYAEPTWLDQLPKKPHEYSPAIIVFKVD